ncbi:hypothetical protein BHE74_00026933, partial [Ensete ventricosum]
MLCTARYCILERTLSRLFHIIFKGLSYRCVPLGTGGTGLLMKQYAGHLLDIASYRTIRGLREGKGKKHRGEERRKIRHSKKRENRENLDASRSDATLPRQSRSRRFAIPAYRDLAGM